MKEPLSITHPEIAAQWHPTKNGALTPDKVFAGSHEIVWWLCPEGPDHEWEAPIRSRAQRGARCHCCIGKKVSVTNSLASIFPQIAAEWHPTKNKELTPKQVFFGSMKRVWWKCSKGSDHEWEAQISKRTRRGDGCRMCKGFGVSVTNSLATRFPKIAAEWHPIKNGDLTPDRVVAGARRKVWWKCSKGPDHEWEARVYKRTKEGQGCRSCRGFAPSITNNLAARFPEIAAEWHPTKNGDLTPDQIPARSEKKVWWKCPKGPDHEWAARVYKRTKEGQGCRSCRGFAPSITNNLAARFPEIAAEWHPTKNGSRTPESVVYGSGDSVWWQCPKGHEYKQTINNRTNPNTMAGCPLCNKGWTIETIRSFISSFKDHLQSFSPAELYCIFQQSGLDKCMGKGRTFVKALATGRFPKEEIEKFVKGEPSLVDKFVEDPTHTLEARTISGASSDNAIDELSDHADGLITDPVKESAQELPVIETKDVLASLSAHVVTSADEEAAEFLLASGVAKIWKHAYHDERTAVAQAEEFCDEGYAEQVRSKFLDEYRRTKELRIPQNYAFHIDGKLTLPNLMQRHFATRVRDSKRVGNWSGTGAGKTLAAILATRVVTSHLTVVCCPNSVVDGWRRSILEIFPDSVVATKTFDPNWAKATGDETGFGVAANQATHRYLVLNYEAFQQPDSNEHVRSLVERELIDFIIVDEIHYTKQRAENISQRRQLITALTSLAAERNPDLHVLGMSATPVINNLLEGKSMVELVSGVAHNELDIRHTVPNCMALHQRLVTLGIRWMPEYNLGYEQLEIEVNCNEFIDEIRALGRNGTPLRLEQILTRARLPFIRKHIQPKTLIYTHYVQEIDRMLRDAIEADGWKVGFYTGEDKSGLDSFLEGDVDVLIGSSAIGTGVDGLQQVCNRLIVNVLPWTAAEFDQLKGRVYRQGQRQGNVTMVIPLTYTEINGQRWSWCESKMHRLRFKKSIADAAVDGVVPEGHLRTPAQAYQDLMAWLERLSTGEIRIITRPKIVIPLPDIDSADVERRRKRYGDFSTMNRIWNQSRSDLTHERLRSNPEEWAQYHTLYREARKGWVVVPYEEMIRWCQQRSGYVIGDFGCGEAKLAEAISDQHTVYSFDHVAVNDNVIACDMAHVPLDDEVLDVAIFSLSLMGANFTDYLREAHRTLKLDGQLHIIEATSRFTDRDQFAEALEKIGFDIVRVEDKWKFTHIHALKTVEQPRENVEIRF